VQQERRCRYQMQQEIVMPPVIAFDMNGTLLDTAALDPLFDAAFRSAHVRREWFMQLIALAMTSAVTGYYTDFSVLGRAALKMTEERHCVALSDHQQSEILQTVRQLPAFPDVGPGLGKLRDDGYRLCVLTNSPLSSAEESLAKAGLRDMFEQVMSVEMVQRFKPAPEVYRTAANKMSVAPSQLMLVAAHSWDTTGAIRAGCRAAFLQRPGEVLDPIAEKPEIVARDMNELVAHLRDAAQAA
jgi:2-haloacid dehalogenase